MATKRKRIYKLSQARTRIKVVTAHLGKREVPGRRIEILGLEGLELFLIEFLPATYGRIKQPVEHTKQIVERSTGYTLSTGATVSQAAETGRRVAVNYMRTYNLSLRDSFRKRAREIAKQERTQ